MYFKKWLKNFQKNLQRTFVRLIQSVLNSRKGKAKIIMAVSVVQEQKISVLSKIEEIFFTMYVSGYILASEFVEKISDNEYHVKTSKMISGQKVSCPDNTTEIEKVDGDTIKLICKKGTCQKITAS